MCSGGTKELPTMTGHGNFNTLNPASLPLIHQYSHAQNLEYPTEVPMLLEMSLVEFVVEVTCNASHAISRHTVMCCRFCLS